MKGVDTRALGQWDKSEEKKKRLGKKLLCEFGNMWTKECFPGVKCGVYIGKGERYTSSR